MPMDIGVPASIDANKCLESTNADTQDPSLNTVGSDVTESENIEDDRDGAPRSKPPYDKFDFQKKDGTFEKSFSKCATFPCSSKTTSSAGTSVAALGANAINVQESTPPENIISADSPCSHSPSLPTAMKPVSAMKGSREKRGVTPPEKLSVKWAPEVYDPVPNSASHTVTKNKAQRHQSKNSSKSKQKKGSKSSHGNKHKNKLSGRGGGG